MLRRFLRIFRLTEILGGDSFKLFKDLTEIREAAETCGKGDFGKGLITENQLSLGNGDPPCQYIIENGKSGGLLKGVAEITLAYVKAAAQLVQSDLAVDIVVEILQDI